MNKDLIIGIVVSALAHWFVLGPFSGRPPEVEVAAPPPPTIEVIEMPDIEPPDPIEPDPSENPEEPPPEFTPPMAADMPSLVTLDSFVQPLQPPPPPSTPSNSGVMTVPVNRNLPTGKMANLFDIKDLDQIPQAISQPQPTWPYELKRQGITGHAVVGFIVDTAGSVRDPYIISSTHTEFEEPALQAVRKWRFRPGRRQGKVVNTRTKQKLSFTLNEGA